MKATITILSDRHGGYAKGQSIIVDGKQKLRIRKITKDRGLLTATLTVRPWRWYDQLASYLLWQWRMRKMQVQEWAADLCGEEEL